MIEVVKLKITESIYAVGVYDRDLDLFEGQYPLKKGVTYNSYVIMDEKIAIMDTVDLRAKDEWLKHLDDVLQNRQPDYLIISHIEPDHGACIDVLCEKYPQMQVVGNSKTFQMMHQFFDFTQPPKEIVVKEGDTLSLGQHTLQFLMAPMVHWPEVMMSYEIHQQILFSADAFGTFASDEAWDVEARRYYYNIVGKYGMQVQNLLKKLDRLQITINKICPLHGPVLEKDLESYLYKYQMWSTYQPETCGVLIACASIHHHTMRACEYLKSLLEEQGETIEVIDLCRADVSMAVAKAFMVDRLVLAASSYDNSVFPAMTTFLHHLQSKNYQNRQIALIENGSFAPSANKAMKAILNEMKQITILNPEITIRGRMKETTKEEMKGLVESLLEGGCQDEICM